MKVNILLIFLIGTTTTQTSEAGSHSEQLNSLDKKYQHLILGSWIRDSEKHNTGLFPMDIEYLKDGTAVLRVFEDDQCENKLETALTYWKIHSGNLYYKETKDEPWSKDSIISMSESHYALVSEGKKLYRIKGKACQ